jgi:hypothetical protein
MSFTRNLKIKRHPAAELRNQRGARVALDRFEPAATAATIPSVDEAKANTPSESDARLDEEMEESRLLMMRRVKQMSIEERMALFDRLSRRVTWARSAKRLR